MSNNIIQNENRDINAFFYIDYEYHKKTMIVQIFKQIDIIINLFDEEFNDNLIKIYILLKKKILNDNEDQIIKQLRIICIRLNKLTYIDQEEYFFIIINLINLHIELCKYKKQIVTKPDNKYKSLVNINLFVNKLNNIIITLSDSNKLLKLLLNIDNKKQIILLAETLAYDYFMYWNSELLYKNIVKNLSNSKNNIIYNLRKYKIEFINAYDYIKKKMFNIYIDHTNIKLVKKFKYENEKKLLNEFIKDLSSIKKCHV